MTKSLRLFITQLQAFFDDQVTFTMAQLNLDPSRSCFTMPRPRSRSDVQMRTDDVEDRRISWPSATSSQKTTLPLVPSSTGRRVGRRTKLAIDVWRRTNLVELCSYLEHHDHAQLRNLLAITTGTLAAAVARYADSDHNIREINRIYYELRRNLWTHMFREEGLYSSICNVERHRVKAVCASGIVTGAIRVMKREHCHFANAFRRIDKLLRGYQIPANAGQKYRDLVQGFRDLEAYKLQHMRHEDIMYSRALALEKQLMGK